MASSPRPRPALVALVALALSGVLSAACGVSGGQGGDGSSVGPDVVVTTTVLGDIVRNVVGDHGRVDVLMQPGQDPHAFALSARQAQAIRQADLVVANGLQLEESLLDVLEAAEQDGTEVLRVAEHLDPIPFAALKGEDEHDEGSDGESDGHGHDGDDPHVWYDPVRMADAARLVAERLAAVDAGGNGQAWVPRGEAVAEDILATHREVEAILAEVPERCRTLVTNHDSFGYLAARYDFEVIGTVVPGTSGQAEPSAQEFAELIETVESSGVPAIFAETIQSTRLAETLASEVGRDVAVVTLFTDALGPPGSGADTYTGMLLTNARRIADALSLC